MSVRIYTTNGGRLGKTSIDETLLVKIDYVEASVDVSTNPGSSDIQLRMNMRHDIPDAATSFMSLILTEKEVERLVKLLTARSQTIKRDD